MGGMGKRALGGVDSRIKSPGLENPAKKECHSGLSVFGIENSKQLMDGGRHVRSRLPGWA